MIISMNNPYTGVLYYESSYISCRNLKGNTFYSTDYGNKITSRGAITFLLSVLTPSSMVIRVLDRREFEG